MFGVKGAWIKVMPYLAMMFLQVGFAGMYVIVMMCLRQGMSHSALIVYRNAVGAVVMAPLALYFERRGSPKMTLPIFLRIVALAILEPGLDQNLGYMGANATSATFCAELYNIVPTVTFILAILLRMEKMKLRSISSQAKIWGAIVTTSGALVMILYKGPIIEFFWLKGRSHHIASASSSHSRWIKGTFMLLTSCFSWAIFYILQLKTLNMYPFPLGLTTLICFMGTLISGVVGVVFERSSAKAWYIGWDTRLVTCIYSGIFCSGLNYYLQGLVLKERGAVFATAFNPLTMIVTAILGSIILAEEITMGMAIGAILLVIGLYSMLWGKSKDQIDGFKENDVKNAELKLPVVPKETG